MPQLNKPFDSSQHEDMGFRPIPAGEYQAHITKSDVKQTRARDGHYVWIEGTVIEGPNKGRKFFDMINYDNPNPIAREIGGKALASLTRAIFGHDFLWKQTEELHGKPFLAQLGIIEAQGQWPAKNNVVSYKSIESNSSEGTTTAGSTSESTEGMGDFNFDDPPWETDTETNKTE